MNAHASRPLPRPRDEVVRSRRCWSNPGARAGPPRRAAVSERWAFPDRLLGLALPPLIACLAAIALAAPGEARPGRPAAAEPLGAESLGAEFLGAESLGAELAAVARSEDASPAFPPWQGRHDAIETALRLGEVVERSRVGFGITDPWKVVIEHHGERLAAVWKPLVDQPRAMHRESWRAEVAAYRLGRYFGLDVVPPTVARTLGREQGSLQLWVDGCRVYREVPADAARPGYRWLHQIDRMRLFDAFIDNSDRNAGNFLVDHDWNVVLIDHSRALPLQLRPRELPELPVRIDAALLERLREVDAEDLRLLLGDLYSKLEIAAMLRHRDRVVRTVEKHLKRGRAALFGEEEAVRLAAVGDGA
ncbi:MAG TPA: hypothetical protein VMV46_20700 [Thermoanaerobaculia bacterium]|nr:hypothetical protein [Thermoanaerobaculia bacterium]